MNRTGFAKLVIFVSILLLAGVAGYLILFIKSPKLAQHGYAPTPNSQQYEQAHSSTPTQKPETPLVFFGKIPTGPNAELYKGYIVVEGEYYEYYPETLGGGILFFKVDEKDKPKLPKKYGEYGEIFAFDNHSAAKQMLNINESVFDNKSVCKLSGRAKIAIEDYTLKLLESAVWDSAKLAQVISFTQQTTETCLERQ